jgi:molecular chaperone HtpG
MSTQEKHEFQAEVNQLLKIVINSLYSHKEIFLRELVSNASDALDKMRFEAITRPELMADGVPLEIRIIPDAEAGTLTISDTGIGMTHDELVKNLGTIAHSGSRAFLEKLQQQQQPNSDINLIGQFGVGFYSSYLVANKVEVISKAAGESEAFCWTSDAKESFTVEPAERETRGTSIVLHLQDDQKNYLQEWEIRDLVSRYSDYVSHPIQLQVKRKEGEGEEAEKQEVIKFETVNQGKALWQRNPSEITKEQYDEFYKHITHDYEPPLAHTHFKIEGTQLFSGLIYFPKRPPFDLYQDKKRGVRLYVKRVFIMEDCEELLPSWLRFARGIVDSDDLPLNVSREILQDSSLIRVIRKQVTKRSLDRLVELSKDSPEDFIKFWDTFGPVLKEAIAVDGEQRDRVVEIARFRTTHADGWTTIPAYIERMPADQPAVYYMIGDSPETVAQSPYLEKLRQKGYEVLLMTDPVDEWAMDSMRKYKEKDLISAMQADLKFDDQDESKKQEQSEAFQPLCSAMKAVLESQIREVRVSDRLTDSPCVLVVPEGGLHASMERMLRAAGRDLPPVKRILEINPGHPVIEMMQSQAGEMAEDQRLQSWVQTLYDQAVLMEGGRVDDPNAFAKRINTLLQDVAKFHMQNKG